MSDNTFKKSPTAFLQNRLSMNRLIQNGSKKRIEKEIEYFKADDTTANGPDTPRPRPLPDIPGYEGSDFHGNNQGLDKQVDGNKAVLDGTCPVWNPKKFKSDAKLRIKTPGFREGCGASKFEDAFYTSKARPQGQLSSSCGLAPHFVKTLKGEARQLDSATFLKITCGTTPTIYAHRTAGGANQYSFFTCDDLYPEDQEYLVWSDETGNFVYTPWYDHYENDIIFSDTTLQTPAGTVVSCFVDEEYEKPMLTGMFRSIELDETVGQTNYLGWFYIGNLRGAGFTQVYTTAEKPAADDPIFLRNINTGTYVQFPEAFKVVTWSAPATMFDVDYEFDYTPDVEVVVPGEAVLEEVKGIKYADDFLPIATHFHYNLRALIAGYYYEYNTKTITVENDDDAVVGTFEFDSEVAYHNYCWKNTDTTSAVQYVYTYDRSGLINVPVYSDELCYTYIGTVTDEEISDTPDESIGYIAYAAPTGNYTNPELLGVGAAIDYTSTDRRETLLEEYQGVDLTPYITEKYWQTANVGYGEVSSQTTLYTETVFRYKDLDAHLSQYLPSDWQGNAYGCVIMADSSASGKLGGSIFLGVSHSDFFLDGSDVYYIIPTNVGYGETGENGPYDLVHAYVYDAALNSIYSTNFAIDTTVSGVTTTRHYISDATKNYMVGDKWRYHYACVEDDNDDVWTKRLAYDFTDIYYLDNLGREIPLDSTKQTLVTPQLFPYSTIYQDNTNRTMGICAWYDFKHIDLTQVTGFTFSSTFKTNYIKVIPRGGETPVDFYKSSANNTWHNNQYWYCWTGMSGTTRVYCYTLTDDVTTSTEFYEDNFIDPWGTISSVESVTREAWRNSGADTTKTDGETTIPMYCWEFYVDPDYEWGGCWVFYVSDAVPTTTSHLWKHGIETWTDTGLTPASIITAPQTWYCYHTSQKETYYIGLVEHERFAAVWATSRNPYEDDVYLAHSNYSAEDPSIPTSPNLNNMIDFRVSHQCYIAPAYQMVVTYDGEDYTFTADYAVHDVHGMDFMGIYYSSWTCDAFKETLYTARITPRVGDNLYTFSGGVSAIAEGFTIKEVKSVVDFIYPGRA